MADFISRALEIADRGKSYKRTGSGLLEKNRELVKTAPALSALKPTPKSGHLITPLHEMEAEYTAKGNLDPWKHLDIEKLQREGASVVPLVGDNTPANAILRKIMGVPVGDVNQQGGGDYIRSEFARGDEPSGWRSRAGAAKTAQGRIAELGKEGPVYGLHTAMGLGSADSSHMMLHSIINQINHLPIKKADINKFDDEMREKFPQTKDYPKEWPGIKDTQGVHDFFYKTGNPKKPYRPGTHVSQFVQNMDSVRWRAAGFPDVGAARFANADPRLLGMPQLSTGYSATKLDPSGKLIPNTPELSHGTYEMGLPHKGYAGGFKTPIQAADIWRDTMAGMPKMISGKPVDYTVPSGKTLLQQTLMTRMPGQKVDQQMVDTVKALEEQGQRFGNYKRGGKAGNIERAMSLTSLYALGHDRDAG